MAKKKRTGKRVKIGGSIFEKTACYKSKRKAARGASAQRKRKHKARVVKSGNSYCVYRGGVAKKKIS